MENTQYTDTPVGRFLAKRQIAARVYDGHEMPFDEQVQEVFLAFDALETLEEAREMVESVTESCKISG